MISDHYVMQSKWSKVVQWPLVCPLVSFCLCSPSADSDSKLLLQLLVVQVKKDGIIPKVQASSGCAWNRVDRVKTPFPLSQIAAHGQ